MIVSGAAYGISITHEFGRGLGGVYNKILKEVENYVDESDTSSWLVDYPSAEENQYVIGINHNPSKYSNYQAVHQMWLDAVAQAPKEIQDLLVGLDPDVHILAGHC